MAVYKGQIVHAPVMGSLSCLENGYIVVRDGCIEGVFPVLPEQYANFEVEDFADKLIIPSFADMHLHAPQYAMLGMGMDLQLLEWLNSYTFPTEAQFRDPVYAREVYAKLADELISLGTTRVCMFATIHRESTLILMEELARAGITGYVGKVNMDRNSPDYLRETEDESISETLRFIEECTDRFENLRPILTPRFTPSCTDGLMQGLGDISRTRGLRVQSHLSENTDEIAWVKALRPDCAQYWESYDTCGLFNTHTVMAHCVYSDERERKAIRERGVWVVHCPDSNINIASGVAPVRCMLDEGLHVTLGSDIAGGAQLCMMDVATSAIRSSKRRWLDTNKEEEFLTVAEAFYLATSAGAEYFGAGPGFQKGDALHALVVDDSSLLNNRKLTLEQRLERMMYRFSNCRVEAVFSEGRRIKLS
jgi:guanine deaminase